MEISVFSTSSLLKVSETTVVDWFNFCRDVCNWKVDLNNLQIGGPSLKVEIDESLLFKRKYNRGRITAQQWFFGGYCTAQKRGFLLPVASRDAATLVPLIQKHVASGSRIHSDQWGAYTHLTSYGWVHLTVNHSQNFVDPDSGAHTQGIESFWNQIKRKLKYVYGSQGDLKVRRINKYVYRHNFGYNSNMHFDERMDLFLSHVAEFYKRS
jgi:hypothetical protein